MRSKMKKKGFLSDQVADYFALLMYVLVLILYFVLFTLSMKGCNGVGQEVSIVGSWNKQLTEEGLLLNYLRTDVEVDGREMNIAELIADSYQRDDYTELTDITTELFEEIDQEVFGESKCAFICIVANHRHVKTIRTPGCFDARWYEYCKTTVATIPLHYSNPGETADIWLSYTGLRPEMGVYAP
jgi:hypothetical protein